MSYPRTSGVELRWDPGGRRIPLAAGHGCLRQLESFLRDADHTLIVTEKRLWRRFGRSVRDALSPNLSRTLLCVPGGESAKTLATLDALASAALRAGATRRSVVISLGGGLVCNVAGMLAATLYRGIGLIHLPTTLLAMHDTVSSLKQALNVGGCKNLLGVYHPPAAVICETAFLRSLPKSAVQAALVEIAKNALVLSEDIAQRSRRLLEVADWDESFFLDVVRSGVEAKRSLMQHDPCEKKRAIVFEYGHTVGHAIEVASAGTIGHGQAVYWGMRAAADVAAAMGYMSGRACAEHEAVLSRLGPVAQPRTPLIARHLLRLIGQDNKRGHLPVASGHIQMVLLRRIGVPVTAAGKPLVQVPLAKVQQAILRLPFVVA